MNWHTPETQKIAESMVGKKPCHFTSAERKLAKLYGPGREYYMGRPTKFWERGEQVTDYKMLKPGDVLIVVNHSRGTENLLRVCEKPADNPLILPGIFYCYADNRTLEQSDGCVMFYPDFAFEPQRKEPFYRAVDQRRDLTRFKNLPTWLEHAK